MSKLYKLFKIQCYDLLCLLEMEHNGIVFNTEKAMEYANELEAKLEKLRNDFNNIVGSNIARISSNDDLSAVLYGGVIVETIRIPVGHYLSGKKKGHVRYKLEDVHHTFDRLVDPLPKTETDKCVKNREKWDMHQAIGEETILKEYWEVNEPVLKSLKARGKARQVIDIVLAYNKMDKLKGTYLEGYTKLIEKQGWKHNMLYGNLNQCVVVTGRLSSNTPNLQNADKETKRYMITRYE